MAQIIKLLIIDGQSGFSDKPDWYPLLSKHLDTHFPSATHEAAEVIRFGESLFAAGLLLPGLDELGVPGTWEDMTRLGKMVNRIGGKFDDIICTLDSHRTIHIAQASYWRNSNGESPPPFTMIPAADIKAGLWTPRIPEWRAGAIAYAEALEAAGKFLLIIWTPHCEIGTPGHNVHPMLRPALRNWEIKYTAAVNYVTKGVAFGREHYGALMAEVPDPNDASTLLNAQLVSDLGACDQLVIAGEALSHCVMTTVNQVADSLGEQHIKKFVLLRDATSPVPAIPGGPDFPALAEAWISSMQAKGMVVTTTVDYLA